MFVMIDSVGIAINANVNVKNWLIKAGVIMGLFGTLVHVNVINHTMLVNTWINWIVHGERGWLIANLKM